MDRYLGRDGLTRVELSLVFGILGCVIALVLPLILDVRESVRKSVCGANLR